ncbi:cytochrome b561 domain-containing protein, partial [Haematococcus lacustris]
MEWQGLMRAHGGVGITLVLVLTFHLILAASRPHPGTSRRPFWELLHTNTGRCLLLLGFTNLMIGPKVGEVPPRVAPLSLPAC